MDWLSRWKEGRTGWHEASGNSALHRFWPTLATGSRVLVPLCGKSPDLYWLSQQDLEVTGVELSEIAARAFFEEGGIDFEVGEFNGQTRYSGLDHAISIVVGDYFQFADKPFDALYDRASLIALPLQRRPQYIRHTRSLLRPKAQMLLVTLEYDQSLGHGPPFSVQADEIRQYWPDARRVHVRDDIDDCPPKFRQAGVAEFLEVAWLSV